MRQNRELLYSKKQRLALINYRPSKKLTFRGLFYLKTVYNGNENRYLFNRIVKRLEFEHNLRHLFATDRIRLDKRNLEIEFL